MVPVGENESIISSLSPRHGALVGFLTQNFSALIFLALYRVEQEIVNQVNMFCRYDFESRRCCVAMPVPGIR
jgi:hypothetical protein